MNLALVKSTNFGQVTCDFWGNENEDVFMTREQIGQALEYNNPEDSIKHIHHRNKDRLDKFSTCVKLSRVEGNRQVSREVTIYNAKGIYEICRFSRQPKADAFMDWAWDVIEEIRKTGQYGFNESAERLKIKSMETENKVLNTRIRQAKEMLRAISKDIDKDISKSIRLKALQLLSGEDIISLSQNITTIERNISIQGDGIEVQLDKFRSWLMTTPINSTAQLLWRNLLEIKYFANHSDWFIVSNSILQSKMSISDKTLDASRKILINHGLIKYESGKNKRIPGRYYLCTIN